MSRLRNAVLGGLLLACACSSTDPPESALGGPGQRAGSVAAPSGRPIATSPSQEPGALPRDTSAAPDSGAGHAMVADAALFVAPEPAPRSGTRNASNEQDTPRDIKVLPAAWSLERVEEYMKSEIERGLGVDCAYCHDRDDYAADHARKDATRRMMRMTMDLDRQYFKGQRKVTCHSCHKGKKKP